MTIVIIIACIITIATAAILIGGDYEPKRSHTKKPKQPKRNTRFTTRRIHRPRANAISKIKRSKTGTTKVKQPIKLQKKGVQK